MDDEETIHMNDSIMFKKNTFVVNSFFFSIFQNSSVFFEWRLYF